MKKFLILVLPFLGIFFSNNSFATRYEYSSLMVGDIIRPPVAEFSNHHGWYYYNFDADTFSSSDWYSQFRTANGFYNSGLGSSSSAITFWAMGDSYVPSYNNLEVYRNNNFMPNGVGQFSYDSLSQTCSVSAYDTWLWRDNGSPSHTEYGDRYPVVPSIQSPYFDSIYADNAFSNSTLYLNRYQIGRGRYFFPDGFDPSTDTYNNSNSGPCYDRFAYNNGISYSFDSQFAFRYFPLNRLYTSTLTGGSNSFDFSYNDGVNPERIFTSDILELRNSSQNNSGTTYTGAFGLGRIFKNSTIPQLSKLDINLDTWSGFYLKTENLYQNRQLEWKILLDFDEGLSMNPDWDTNGTSAQIVFENAYKIDNYGLGTGTSATNFDCTYQVYDFNNSSNVVTPSEVQLEFTCPVTLPIDYLGFSPHFVLTGGSNGTDNLWVTSSFWDFYSITLTTDNNADEYAYFNDTGTSNYWFYADGYDDNSSPNWFASLTNLFNFSLPNTPIGLLFGQFNNDTCASIPTIASMLHSTETEVCPVFSSEIRSITTPILSLFSSMLLFGFIVHWLGGSSGNFEADNTASDGEGYSISGSGRVSHRKGYRRK